MGTHFAKNTLFSLQLSMLILRTSHFRYEIRKKKFRPHLFVFFSTNISFVQTTGTQKMGAGAGEDKKNYQRKCQELFIPLPPSGLTLIHPDILLHITTPPCLSEAGKLFW